MMRKIDYWLLHGLMAVFAFSALAETPVTTEAWTPEALPRTVEITSSVGGFGQGRMTRVWLRHDGDDYQMEIVETEVRRSEQPPHALMPQRSSAPVTRVMSAAKVRRLIEVMRMPASTTIDPVHLVPLATWQTDLDALWKPEKWSHNPGAYRAAQNYRERMQNPETLAALLHDGMSQVALDHEGGVSVKALFDDDSALNASASGHVFRLLPWRNTHQELRYSTDFPDALIDVLPENAINREQLVAELDTDKRHHLLKFGLIEINANVDAIARVPAAYRRLREQFHMRAMAIDDRASLNAVLRDPRARGPERLRVLLMRKQSDRPVTGFVEFALQGGDLADPRDIQRIERRFERIQSDAALKNLPAGTALSFEFAYMGLDETLVRSQFITQMARGTRFRFDAADPALKDAFVVSQGPLQWMLLDDGRTVRWKSAAGKPDAPGQWRCANAPTATSIGTVMPDEDDSNPVFPNVCFGEVFDAQGKRIE